MKKVPTPLRLAAVAGAAAACALPVTTAHAQDGAASTASDDFQVRYGASVRYNLGVRMEDRNPLLAGDKANQTAAVYAGSLNTDEGTYSANKGSVAINRLDLLGELELSWRRVAGIRATAAAWKDFAVHDSVRKNPDGGVSSYFNDTLSSTTRRLHGQGAEVLDAYGFYQDQLGGNPFSMKLGRFAELWG